MKYIELDQNTEEWKSIRAGKITASSASLLLDKVGGLTAQQQTFVDAILKEKLEPKEAAKKAGYKSAPRSDLINRALSGEVITPKFKPEALDYAGKLAIERISNKPFAEEVNPYTKAMQWGHDNEPLARSRHAEVLGTTILESGFFTNDDEWCGASPDGLIGEDGLAEYKCFTNPRRIRAVYFEKDITEFLPQIQFQLWITERKWCDFCLYVPDLAAAHHEVEILRVKRDEVMIQKLKKHAIELNQIIDNYKHEFSKSCHIVDRLKTH